MTVAGRPPPAAALKIRTRFDVEAQVRLLKENSPVLQPDVTARPCLEGDDDLTRHLPETALLEKQSPGNQLGHCFPLDKIWPLGRKTPQTHESGRHPLWRLVLSKY